MLCVTALGDSLRQAQRARTTPSRAIHFDGMQYRARHRPSRDGAQAVTPSAAARRWTSPRVARYFTGLQARIVAALEAVDGGAFRRDAWTRPEGGGGTSRA